MMPNRSLPETPADVFKFTSFTQLLKAQYTIMRARLFGYWRIPIKAATAPEEMDCKDAYYWIYKSKTPITQTDNSLKESIFRLSSHDIKLPEPFHEIFSATIGAAGDILLTEDIEYSQDSIFNDISDILFNNDISFANLESPITHQPLIEEVLSWNGPPIECCSPTQFDIIKGYKGKNFDILNVANNHTLDMGIEGIETTQRILHDNKIIALGTNTSPHDYGTASIIVKNGIKFGFISDCFSLNGKELPVGEKYRVHLSRLCSKHAPPQLTLLKQQVDFCKSQSCDFIIASIHWGYEFEFFPRQAQADAARELIEYGVDVILGHHPHVVQPVEYYRTQRDPHRIAVIAYSLGSLLWRFTAPHLALGMVLNLKICKGISQGKTVTYLQMAKVNFVYRTTHLNKNQKPQVYLNKIVTVLESEVLISRHDAKKLSAYIHLLSGKI